MCMLHNVGHPTKFRVYVRPDGPLLPLRARRNRMIQYEIARM